MSGFRLRVTLLLPLFAPHVQAQSNVVLITIDTLRADRLSAYGYAGADTPASTQLARDGILLERAIVQTPFTLPSHATILTGTYPVHHGVQDVVGRLRSDLPTLAEWFRQRGYATGAFIGASVLMAQWGLDRGFDRYDDRLPPASSPQVDFDRLERPAQEVIDSALKWIETARKPFFVWIHLYDPHDPYEPPAPFAERFRNNPYDGEIAYVESQLSRLLEMLQSKGWYSDALIVYTADHGESLGEHQETYHGFFVYDASLHVPLIIKPPAKTPLLPGTRVPNQVRSVDIAPTIAQLLGEQIPAWVQGEGLAAILSRKRPDLHLPAYAESHYPRIHFGWSPLFSFGTPDFKYIEAPKPELYDLRADPREENNIFSQNQAMAHRLREELKGIQRKFATVRRPGPDISETVDPATLERLKSLGYIAFSGGDSAPEGGKRSDPKDKIQVYNQLNRGIDQVRRNRLPEAVAIFEQVARQEPGMPLVHYLLGTELYNLGQYLRAVESFQTSLQLRPESNQSRFNLARAYNQAGLTDKGESTLRALLDRDPSFVPARHLLAGTLARQGKYEEAVQEQIRGLELQPHSADGYNNLGSYYLQLGKTAEAAQSYEKAIQLEFSNLPARTNLALVYLKQKRYLQVIDQAHIIIQQDPRASRAYFYLGEALLATGRKDLARAAFLKAKELDPRLHVPTI